MTIPKIVTENSITVFANGKTLIAQKNHPAFSQIRDFLKSGKTDIAALVPLFDVKTAIETRSQGKVKIERNGSDFRVLYDGKELHTSLSRRMVSMLAEGFSVDPLVNFMERLYRNPSFRAVNGLYDFLEATNLPITADGKFLAYKKVRDDYKDFYTGTMLNAVGTTVAVQRNMVDEDPNRTCSHGLHVCSESYLNHYHGGRGRVLVCEVDPEHVVAVPTDYNNAKMRVSQYFVRGEVAEKDAGTNFTTTVVDTNVPAPTPAEPNFLDYNGEAADDETLVVREIAGRQVVFQTILDEDGDIDYWLVTWTDEDGDEREEDLWSNSSLEDAIEVFKENHITYTATWGATVRWLDDLGDVQEEDVTVEIEGDEDEVDEVPDDYVFIDEAAGVAAWDDGVRVRDATQLERKEVFID